MPTLLSALAVLAASGWAFTREPPSKHHRYTLVTLIPPGSPSQAVVLQITNITYSGTTVHG